ncbi:Hypothetical predicted protein, partial [Pelobates cultripes]
QFRDFCVSQSGGALDSTLLEQRSICSELATAADLIIKPSDKGGNIVLMDKDHYLEMCMEHLRDTQAYQKLTRDPTPQFLNKLKSILTPAFYNGIITQDEHKFILPHLTPTVATLYCLPKVHKNIHKPPGRPIVSGNGSITERSSKYLENLLHPIVVSLPSYLQDTKQTLILLENLILAQ